ncbi:MAG: hypothetical protein DI533_06900 [Cereibacter sphaeroides]|uniref:Cytochrome C oxidase assembly protein n=1 Tax=Cereibacter sphaeroides TaxID=1063 RepID=A0A2W5TXW2_CERSP|nr:MAG: hypothetical protein DI533_06900 [Cereibacter sphaeroides]
MAIRAEHEIHRRRLSRNLGVAITLAAFVALVFGLTVVKVSETGPIEGYGTVVQPQPVSGDSGQ